MNDSKQSTAAGGLCDLLAMSLTFEEVWAAFAMGAPRGKHGACGVTGFFKPPATANAVWAVVWLELIANDALKLRDQVRQQVIDVAKFDAECRRMHESYKQQGKAQGE